MSDEPQAARAMGLMVVAMAFLPCIDAIAKFLSDAIGAGQVTWSRLFFQALLMAPLAWRIRLPMRRRALVVHAARGILLALATVLFFHALAYMPLADAISIFFVEPLILTVLSVVFLHETVGWRRSAAIAVGLAGAMLVIRPSFADVGWQALLPLAAATCFAFYLLATRHSAQRDDPARMQFFAGLFGALAMTLVLLVGQHLDVPALAVVRPDLVQWGLLLALGVIATAGHLLVVMAFRLASASKLAPFQYLELVSATLLGWLVFDDFPDLTTGLGAAVIVVSGLYVFHRERVTARSARAAPSR